MANPITPAEMRGLVLCPEHDRDTICFSRQRAEQVNAALLQGAEALERTTWQPISTAPEATPVLVWLPNYGAVRAIKTTVHGIANWWGESNRLHPTHWMPLSAAPVGRTEETR